VRGQDDRKKAVAAEPGLEHSGTVAVDRAAETLDEPADTGDGATLTDTGSDGVTLEGPVAAVRTPTVPAERGAPVEGPPVGRYRPLREIGHGGMGRVVLADDTRLARRVALKTVLGDMSARARLRFLEEARATAQLEHPNIVPVYDLEGIEAGEPFFSMRFVEGRSLASAIDALRAGEPGGPGPAELLLVFLKICDAVAYAHDRGVLHRDLKPDNVMLGRFGEVFVMDWGLARVGSRPDDSGEWAVTTVRDSAPAALTAVGTILGTPGYMAPERISGDPEAIDARSDVWALGAILYEVLTLEPAVDGPNTFAILAATTKGEIVRPRLRAPSRNVSAGLDAVVMRALALRPEDRTPSAAALREAIAAELEGSREAARRRAAAETKLQAAGRHLARHREAVQRVPTIGARV
jgi:serine/threonine-protein kinase